MKKQELIEEIGNIRKPHHKIIALSNGSIVSGKIINGYLELINKGISITQFMTNINQYEDIKQEVKIKGFDILGIGEIEQFIIINIRKK